MQKYLVLTEDLGDGKSHRNSSFPDKIWRQKCLGLIPEDATYFQLHQKSVFALAFLRDLPVVKQRDKWMNLVSDLKSRVAQDPFSLMSPPSKLFQNSKFSLSVEISFFLRLEAFN